jgi:hypothetical protein
VAFDPDRFDRFRSDQTAVHQLQFVRAVPMEPDMASVVDRETDTSPPAQPVRGAGDLLDLDGTLDAGEPPKLFSHYCGL